MALNEIFKEANHLSLPVPADVPAGSPVRIGVLNGFTETPEGAGVGNVDGYASINMKGAFKVEVEGALTKGQEVFITPTNTLTTTAGMATSRLALRSPNAPLPRDSLLSQLLASVSTRLLPLN